MAVASYDFRSLLLVIAGLTKKELVQQIQYLKAENEILRAKLPKRIVIETKERRKLLKYAAKLSRKVLKQLTSIVSPDTFLRWFREERRSKHKPKPPSKRGRTRSPEQIRKLIIKLAKENNWGYTRILGELKKLGIRSVSRNTVKNILKENGLAPGPVRGEGAWDEFLKRHAKSLWQCDFLGKRIITRKGIRYAFVIVWINLKTRRVFASPATLNPTQEWSAEQTRIFVEQARAAGMPIKTMQMDHDSKFGKLVRAKLKSLRVKSHLTTLCSPNLYAYVERVIQSIQKVCLEHFLVFGKRHSDDILKEYLAHYHDERPHQSLDNRPPGKLKPDRFDTDLIALNQVRCQQRLGGLLKSYSRAA